MVIVRLVGGLGNQMFQYAMGRRLAASNRTPLKLDVSAYEGNTPDAQTGVRIFGLQNFNITAEIASRAEVCRVMNRNLPKQFGRIMRGLDRARPYYLRRCIVEPEELYWTFDPRMASLKVRGSAYLQFGFWQSTKYLTSIESSLRTELTIKDPPTGMNAKLCDDISRTNSIAVHIRHGDNAHPAASRLGALPLEHYYACAERAASEVAQPHFYVFSDDPQWTQENVRLNYPTTFVTHNGDDLNYEDLRLMTLCRHHVISNSTFSWWGAWLGKKPGQIVYAPRKYYQQLDQPMPDFYPNEWRLV